jgi:hypothetical protein
MRMPPKITNSLLAPVLISIVAMFVLQIYWDVIAHIIPKSRFPMITGISALVICALTAWRSIDAFNRLSEFKMRQARAARFAQFVEGQLAIRAMLMGEELDPNDFVGDGSVFVQHRIIVLDMEYVVISGPSFDPGMFEPPPTMNVLRARKRRRFASFLGNLWRRCAPFLGNLWRNCAPASSYLVSPWRWSGPSRRLLIVLLIAAGVVMLAAYGILAFLFVEWLGGVIAKVIIACLDVLRAFADPAHPIDYVVAAVCLATLVLCRLWSNRVIRRRIPEVLNPHFQPFHG